MGTTLLVAINARYSHTNLAVRSLRRALEAAGIPAEVAEYTINQPDRELLADIARREPERVLLSCYLWNIETVRRVGADLRLLFPELPILLGGPEVSFGPKERLASMPWADAILCGEGEALTPRVLRGSARPRGVFRAEGFVDLDALPFPYDDLDALQDRVLYYESSRGCPFGCAYCLSSADRVVRYRSLPLVFEDLRRFLDAGAMQVKFVDRTFNADPARALAIWRFLVEQDNGRTSFQMEVGGDLLDSGALELFRRARPGLFQLEIGVQSTCPEALEAACRKTDLPRLFRNVRAVQAAGNVHQHLDLIAGLPMEGFSRFTQSYDEVFALHPEQLQLGFLKLLRGSTLYDRRADYGLVHSETPPYEILSTPWLSFRELCRLKAVEAMTETYHNSDRFSHTLGCLMERCPSPFAAMLELGESMPDRSVGKYEYYDLLYAFCVKKGCDPERVRRLLKFDLCLHERPRRLPACLVGTEPSPEERRRLAALALPKRLYAEAFPFDVTAPGCPPGRVLLAFDHDRRDLSGHASWTRME